MILKSTHQSKNTRNKVKLYFSLIFLSILFVGVNAQKVQFNYADGNTNFYSLDDIRKMTFDNNYVTLEFRDGTTFQRNMNDVVSFKYTDVTGIEAIKGLNVIDFKLYPNPNNGTFNVGYTLDKQTNVKLTMYGIDGKLIKELYSGEQTVGDNNFTYNLHDLSDGIYFIQLKTEAFTVTKKLVINQ
jgi:hypothetical protein